MDLVSPEGLTLALDADGVTATDAYGRPYRYVDPGADSAGGYWQVYDLATWEALRVASTGVLGVRVADTSAAAALGFPSPPAGDRVPVGFALRRGGVIRSRSGRTELTLDAYSGALSLYDYKLGKATWNSPGLGLLNGGGIDLLAAQPDGNLVGYAADGSVKWQTNTNGAGGGALLALDDGNLAWTDPAGTYLWQTATFDKQGQWDAFLGDALQVGALLAAGAAAGALAPAGAAVAEGGGTLVSSESTELLAGVVSSGSPLAAAPVAVEASPGAFEELDAGMAEAYATPSPGGLDALDAAAASDPLNVATSPGALDALDAAAASDPLNVASSPGALDAIDAAAAADPLNVASSAPWSDAPWFTPGGIASVVGAGAGVLTGGAHPPAATPAATAHAYRWESGREWLTREVRAFTDWVRRPVPGTEHPAE